MGVLHTLFSACSSLLLNASSIILHYYYVTMVQSVVRADGQSPMNCPTSPRSDRETATLIGWSGGRSISGIESSFLTKLGGSAGGSFLPWAARSLRKEEAGEGGGGGSPPPGAAMEGS
jgi:hypothetical protein